MSDSSWPHGLQHARLLCPPLTPGVCSNSCPLNRWCYLTLLSSPAPSPYEFKLSQDQGLFQWVSSLHQVAKVLKRLYEFSNFYYFLKIPHISELIQYLSFYVWLISLSIMPSRFIHDVVNSRNSPFFNGRITFVCGCMYLVQHFWPALDMSLIPACQARDSITPQLALWKLLIKLVMWTDISIKP